jgi:hypothetical protein
VASIERTAYPRLKRVVSARELHEAFTPTVDEIGWARERTRSPQHLLALVVLLKTYHRLGYFADLFEVPLPIVEHVRGVLELKPEVDAEHDSERTLRLLVSLIYDRSPARLGRGDRWDRSLAAVHHRIGVTHSWHAPAGHRGAEWLKRGMPSSK